VQVLNYARNLKYEEKPNYEKIERVLKNVLSKGSGKLTAEQMKYDWTAKNGHNISENQATVKRKALHSLVEKCTSLSNAEVFIKGGHFPTIMEESTEDIISCIIDGNQPIQRQLIREETILTQSPQLTGYYNELQDTPKLDTEKQPTLKNRMIVPNVSNVQTSPWNCSEGTDERGSIPDKVNSIKFKTAMGMQ